MMMMMMMMMMMIMINTMESLNQELADVARNNPIVRCSFAAFPCENAETEKT